MNAKQREKKMSKTKRQLAMSVGNGDETREGKKKETLNRWPQKVAKKVSKSWLVVVFRVRDKVLSGGGVERIRAWVTLARV